MNSSSDLERYSRHLILKEIGGPGLKKLKNSSVLIIGLGGLGSPLLQYLCTSGIGSIGLVDFDKIELSNLNRQIIYGTSDVGKNKTDIARKIAKNLNPLLRMKANRIVASRSFIGAFLIQPFDRRETNDLNREGQPMPYIYK